MSYIAKRTHKENPEIGIKIALAHKGKKFSKEHREKISKKIKEFYKRDLKFNRLENNPLWQGGISFHPYNLLFNKNFKRIIKEKYDEKCAYCHSEENGCVHHINYIKNHSTTMNCVWLCSSCNSKFNANRDYWFAYWCDKLGVEPEDNINEAEMIDDMNKQKLINFMKAKYNL